MQRPMHGEILCQKEGCQNRAYWELSDAFLCGVHARNKELRVALEKTPEKEKKRLFAQKIADNKRTAKEAARANNGRGSLDLFRMRMMKEVPLRDGWLNVYPNFRHQNRQDGIGCKSLSPMSLGPVEHACPSLPPAQNIENFFQGSKVFSQEVDENGNPTELFYENRERLFADPVPKRHKYHGKNKNKNIPLYFLWTDSNGKEHRLDYIKSRQTYCNFFERLASETKDYRRLCRLQDRGYNLVFCGYDAHGISEATSEAIEKAYIDPSVPFGHERVLFAMLALRDTPEEYPWRKHKTLEF
ncbi:hypothetical protein D1R32_gp418 [Tunisvirus fontaine2]|uniref:Uncharacterized protein n=1 Tax=Tunisvirus fontaine2 TaxID=1421067 RepID=V9SEI8_9VIRU|nr:hypothetical protein D1R32_gp418 [Tunisvirus fontaine2]AHC55135.1 hypothetical protein TNS_ORF417 [Tunisvirus fontaine2]